MRRNAAQIHLAACAGHVAAAQRSLYAAAEALERASTAGNREAWSLFIAASLATGIHGCNSALCSTLLAADLTPREAGIEP
jgi:hypothetical protein